MKYYRIFEFRSVSKDGYEINAHIDVNVPLLLLGGVLLVLTVIALSYAPL